MKWKLIRIQKKLKITLELIEENYLWMILIVHYFCQYKKFLLRYKTKMTLFLQHNQQLLFLQKQLFWPWSKNIRKKLVNKKRKIKKNRKIEWMNEWNRICGCLFLWISFINSKLSILNKFNEFIFEDFLIFFSSFLFSCSFWTYIIATESKNFSFWC